MASLPPDVVVIVVAYRGDRWVERCVESLYATTQIAFELVLIDNGETPAIERLAGRYESMRVIKTPRSMGFADANNFALSFIRDARYVCFLNQDTVNQPMWLERCIAALDADAGLAAVVPVTYTYDGTAYDAAFMDCAGREPAGRVMRVDHIPAAAMVARTASLDVTGGFDPLFGSYYEDYDLCRRFREAGFSLAIAGDATIRHFSGSATNDPAAVARRSRLLVRNRAIHEIRAGGKARTSSIIKHFAFSFPRRLMRSLLGRSPHSVGHLIGGYFDLLPSLSRLANASRDAAELNRDLKNASQPEIARDAVDTEAMVTA